MIGAEEYEGQRAATAAARLARRPRHRSRSRPLELDQIAERLPLAVDRAMGEAGLWAPELAARALRQAQGDPVEAAQLLRAYRSTMPRLAYSSPATTEDLRVTRRISSAFRNPPGGQLLGRTLDYVGRLLDLLPEDEGRSLASRETSDDVLAATEPEPTADDGHGPDGHDAPGADVPGAGVPEAGAPEADAVERAPKNLLAVLRTMDVVAPAPKGTDPDPHDITRVPARSDASRSAWLQAMARADTGSLMHTWYGSNWRPSGHEIPGEVRHGTLPVRVTHPGTGRAVTLARVQVSEVQTFHSLTRAGELSRTLDVGYGLCFGHNDRKAISMAGLDLVLTHHQGGEGPFDEVLFTLDGLDSAGYVQHLKLPHHVEFRSLMERGRAVTAGRAPATECVGHMDHADIGEKE